MTLLSVVTVVKNEGAPYNIWESTGVAFQQGTLALPDTWFRHFLELDFAPIVQISFPGLVLSFLDFSP